MLVPSMCKTHGLYLSGVEKEEQFRSVFGVVKEEQP